ncbi:DinB family protein [Flavobacterium sp. J49]|uniref:DinB family protein n=1 Tax=Flavobacterium sp. J49 TaxID=2718534 RepID=UPI0015942F15|nr:DinB family protein [Flavobacterium sp. J49]MBF6642250.1 DinB family protein [Flavobacterium sp. J49]NIC03496.1 DinB family protein [Flavobacterium sp. J49]
MKQLHELLNQIESHIAHHEKTNPVISQATVGWQLDHSLLVINGVIAHLKNSNPENYKWKFKWIRLYIQITNKIPRGKVRVPKSVKPVDVATIEELESKLKQARTGVAEIQNLHPNSYFTHPFFGDLNLKTTIWFLKLHTKHHLKIVNDIINKG